MDLFTVSQALESLPKTKIKILYSANSQIKWQVDELSFLVFCRPSGMAPHNDQELTNAILKETMSQIGKVLKENFNQSTNLPLDMPLYKFILNNPKFFPPASFVAQINQFNLSYSAVHIQYLFFLYSYAKYKCMGQDPKDMQDYERDNVDFCLRFLHLSETNDSQQGKMKSAVSRIYDEISLIYRWHDWFNSDFTEYVYSQSFIGAIFYRLFLMLNDANSQSQGNVIIPCAACGGHFIAKSRRFKYCEECGSARCRQHRKRKKDFISKHLHAIQNISKIEQYLGP